MRLTRIGGAVLTAAVLLAAMEPLALAQSTPLEWPSAVQGQPSLHIRSQAVYYIWYDAAGWHVRWTTPFTALFTGLITTNGAFQNVRGTGVTAIDQRVVFASLTFAGVNGVDFQTTGSTLTFNLAINQSSIVPSRVFLGRSGVHPSSMPFTVTLAPSQAQTQQMPEFYIDVREQLEEQRNADR